MRLSGLLFGLVVNLDIQSEIELALAPNNPAAMSVLIVKRVMRICELQRILPHCYLVQADVFSCSKKKFSIQSPLDSEIQPFAQGGFADYCK